MEDISGGVEFYRNLFVEGVLKRVFVCVYL